MRKAKRSVIVQMSDDSEKIVADLVRIRYEPDVDELFFYDDKEGFLVVKLDYLKKLTYAVEFESSPDNPSEPPETGTQAQNFNPMGDFI